MNHFIFETSCYQQQKMKNDNDEKEEDDNDDDHNESEASLLVTNLSIEDISMNEEYQIGNAGTTTNLTEWRKGMINKRFPNDNKGNNPHTEPVTIRDAVGTTHNKNGEVQKNKSQLVK